MTVYELIQELTQYDANMPVEIKVKSNSYYWEDGDKTEIDERADIGGINTWIRSYAHMKPDNNILLLECEI